MATLGQVMPPANGKGRQPLKAVIALLLVVATLLLVLLLKPEKLDVYRTISELKFADPALEKCVKETARANKWTDVGHFVSLRCNNPVGDGIKKLDGIEHLVELTEVNFSFNRISDIGSLARLPRLVIIDLSHNNIRGMPVFDSNVSLQRIELNYNLMESLEWLTTQHFAVLSSLSIAHNHISNLSGLASHPNVSELNVRNNQISDLAPILNLNHLVMLDAGSNNIDDVSGIGKLVDLRRLFLDRNRLSSIDGLESLHRLEELDLANNALSGTAPISQLERLQRLNLNQTGITSLSDVLALGDLELLRISRNPGLTCESIVEAIGEYGQSVIRTDRVCPDSR